MKKIIALIALFAAFYPAIVVAQKQHTIAKRSSAINKKTKPVAVNKPAPLFTLKDTAGNDIALSSFKGNFVLVDFWASWCMPCRAAIPQLKVLYNAYHATGFAILSVSADANSNAWKKAVAQEQMPWQQVIDNYTGDNTSGDTWAKYALESVPYSVLLNKEGIVMAINPSIKQVEQMIAAVK